MKEKQAINVLIIEDDPQFTNIARRMLDRDLGVIGRCRTAGSLADGLSIMKDEPVDLVLLDLRLPDSEGLESLKTLKRAGHEIPIVVLTGEGTDEMSADALREGAIDYLLKSDVTGRYLSLAVMHALERHNLLQQLKEQQTLLENTVKRRTQKISETVETLENEINKRKKAEKRQKTALEESVRREREMSALLQGAKAILRYRRFEDSARAVFDICKELLGASAGYVALLSEDGQENELLFLEAGGRSCTVNPDLPMPIRGLRATAYHSGMAVFENDFMNSQWMEFMPSGHVQLDNVLFAPLNIDGRTEGIIGLANKPGGFNENDVTLAAAMAEIVSIAFINSKTMDSLQESQMRFRELYNRMSSGVAIYAADESGQNFYLKDMNRSGQLITGLKEENYRNKIIQKVFPGINNFGLLEVFQRVWQTGQPELFPAALYQDARLTKWFENSVYKLPNGELVVVFSDVTERMNTQESLRKNEELYRSLINSCPDPVLIYDANGNVITVNPAFEKVFGWKSDEIVETPFRFETKDQKKEIHDIIKKLIKGGTIVNKYTKHLTKSGKVLDTDISASRYFDDKGNLAGYVVFLRDISERIILENHLKQSEKNLRIILESIQAGVMMINRLNHEIEYVNPVAAKHIGRPMKEIIGKVCHSFICPTEKGKCPAVDLNQKIDKSQRTLLNAQREEIPILKTVIDLKLGEKSYLLESFIDISELRTIPRRAIEP